MRGHSGPGSAVSCVSGRRVVWPGLAQHGKAHHLCPRNARLCIESQQSECVLGKEERQRATEAAGGVRKRGGLLR